MNKIYLTILFVFLSLISFTQSIAGYVTDVDNEPLENVNIHVLGTNYGGVSNQDGEYKINLYESTKYKFEFSLLGYKTQVREINLKKKSFIEENVILENEIYITDEIIIEAERNIEERVLDIPVRTKSLNIQEINSIPAISTDKILQGISGLNVSSDAGVFSSTKISMRGLGGNSKGGTLIVLDGSPINKSDAGSVNWSMIDKDNISSIDIIKGPGSAMFGSNAMGGVINIITRKPTNRFNANLGLSYGTYNTLNSKLRLSGLSKNSKLYWKSFVSYKKSDGYINTPDDVILENDSIVVPIFLKDYSLNGFVGYNIDEKNTVELSVSYFDDNKGRGVKIYESNGANTQRNTVHSFVKYRGQLGNVSLFANVYVLFEDYFRLNEYYSDGEYALYEINSARLENGAKSFAQYNLNENIELTAGVEYKSGSVIGSDIYYTSTDVIRNQGDLDIYSGFAQAKIKLAKSKFVIVPGIRYDLANFSNASFSIENPSYSIEYLSEFQFSNTKPVHWSSFSPKLAMEYAMNKENKLFLSVAKGFRAPILDDLCRSDQVRTGFRIANPEINAEYLYSFELGADFTLFEGFYAGLSAYYNIGKDFMYLISTGDSVNLGYTISPIYKTDNIGEVKIYGIETDLSYHINKKLNVFANHTWNNSIISDFVVNPDGAGTDLNGKHLTGIPDHKVSGGISVFTKHLSASVLVNYNGTRWINDDNSIETDYFLSDKYPAYYTMDLKVWRKIKSFEVGVTVDNILNEIYTNSRGYKCPGRMMIFELNYNFIKNENEK